MTKSNADNRIMRTWNEAESSLVDAEQDEWVNSRTGEVRVMQNIEKRYYGQKHFWKMYLMDFLAVLGIVESKQLDVICYIMENTQAETNLFIGTQKKIAEELGLCRQTVAEAMRKLQSCNFMTKTDTPGVYRINADVMVKGSEAKKRGLVITYNEERTVAAMREAKREGCLDPADEPILLAAENVEIENADQ